jgi:hypothetical protein
VKGAKKKRRVGIHLLFFYFFLYVRAIPAPLNPYVDGGVTSSPDPPPAGAAAATAAATTFFLFISTLDGIGIARVFANILTFGPGCADLRGRVCRSW